MNTKIIRKAINIGSGRSIEPALFSSNQPKNDIMEKYEGRLQVNDFRTGGRPDVEGKRYPGMVNYYTQKVMAIKSVNVRSIITLRTQQVAKLPPKIIPKRKEPSRQVSIMAYRSSGLHKHPAFDGADVSFLIGVYDRLDPYDTVTDKRKQFEDKKKENGFSQAELKIITNLQEKHDKFYEKREKDIRRIEELLNRPDPYFTNTTSWYSFVVRLINDILVMDRGCFVKIRNSQNQISGLMPVDGAFIFPIINEWGFVDEEKAYVQDTGTGVKRYLNKNDTVILMMHPTTDTQYFGYGQSPMETLYNVVLADIFIDKGQVDYYQKGGTLPEIILNLLPPTGKDGTTNQYSQEQLDSLQRRVSAALLGDTTQLPIVSGVKAEVIELKGSRKDGQYLELADYVSRKICAGLQVNPQDIGIVSGVKQSDADVQQDLTKQKGLLTLMTVISEYITNSVVDEIREEKDLKLWFEDDDSKFNKARWDIMKSMIDANYYTINDLKSQEGEESYPWGDVPMQGVQMWEPPEVSEQKEAADKAQGGTGMPGGLPGLDSIPPEMIQKSVVKTKVPEYPQEKIRHKKEIKKSLNSLLQDYTAEEFSKSNQELYSEIGKLLLKSSIQFDPEYNSENVLPLSKFDDGIVSVGNSGNELLPQSIAKAYFQNLPETKQKILEEKLGKDLNIVLEQILLESYPQILKSQLSDIYYDKIPKIKKEIIEDTKKVIQGV